MLTQVNKPSMIQALDLIHPLGPESQKQIQAITEQVTLEKSQLLLPFGKTCKDIYFVESGFLRIFYIKDGKEVTEWFADQGEFCFSIDSYFHQAPSNLAIECLEDSSILKISKKGIDKLTAANLEIANLVIKMFSGSLILSQKRMNSIQFETARERYEQLEKLHPNLLKKAPLQHIASFLGITSETLSRIRSARI